jgi:hypothetical protein
VQSYASHRRRGSSAGGGSGDGGAPAQDGKGVAAPATAAIADDISWVGHVSDLCDDGHVQVRWFDGNTSKVSPYLPINQKKITLATKETLFQIAKIIYVLISDLKLLFNPWMLNLGCCYTVPLYKN